MNIQQQEPCAETLKVVASLTKEELESFNDVNAGDIAIKSVVEAAMRSATDIGREIIHKRTEFWTNIIAKYNLPPQGKYAIDVRNGSVMMPEEEDDGKI